jgi:hypothetical protein
MNVLCFFSRWQSPGDFISLAAVHISYLSELICPHCNSKLSLKLMLQAVVISFVRILELLHLLR